MNKPLLTCLLFILSFGCLRGNGQINNLDSLLLHRHIPDSVLRKDLIKCGVSPAYFVSLGVDTTGMDSVNHKPINQPNNITIAANFPAGAVETCGHFVLYYEDEAIAINGGAAGGFADAALGAGRRATMCAVLGYIESVLNFNNVSGNLIPIHISQSYSTAGGNASPAGTDFFAKGGPHYFIPAVNPGGFINGFVNDYITTGNYQTDPNSGYQGDLMVNFDAVYDQYGAPVSFVYHNTPDAAIHNCDVDLYTVLLHEMSHVLGWFSLVEFPLDPDVSSPGNYFYNHVTPVIPPVSATGTNLFTGIDNSIYANTALNFGVAILYPAPILTKLISGGNINQSMSIWQAFSNLWINDNAAPDNYPVYSGNLVNNEGPDANFMNSYISHLDDQYGSYQYTARVSPGDEQEYVIAPYAIKGVLRRTYTKGEFEAFINSLNYQVIPGAFLFATNHIPYSIRMGQYIYFNSFIFDSDAHHAPDYVIINDAPTPSVVINVSGNPDFVDPDPGDQISIMPETIINYRGCGSGGNNHNQLVLSNNNQTITFTPRTDFYGKAQFGFNITDGKEKGSFVIYTIDVEKGTNIVVAQGDNLVLNHRIEEGSETKILGAQENNANSVSQEASVHIGKLYDINYPDSHPDGCGSNVGDNAIGFGTVIHNSRINCDGSSYTSIAGSPTTSWPSPGLFFPDADDSGGERYQAYKGIGIGGYYLGDSVRKCKHYILSFDLSGTTNSNSTNVSFSTNFAAGVQQTFSPTNSFSTPVSNSWQRVTVSFWYCGDPANVMYLRVDGGDSTYYFVDNLCLTEDYLNPPQLTASVIANNAGNCLTTLSADVQNPACYVTYSWAPGGATTSTINAASNVAQVYTVTASDACRTATATYTVTPILLTATAAPNPMCTGQQVSLTAGGTPGATYTWTPAVTCTSTDCSTATDAPATTTTYTVTSTGSNGCTAQITETVTPALTATITPNGATTFCTGDNVTLNANTGTGYTYVWQQNGNTIGGATAASYTAATGGTYGVTITTPAGCTGTATVTVTVNPLPVITAGATQSMLCPGQCTALLAAGGTTYSWAPATGLSCTSCANPAACPSVTTAYTVTGTDGNGCHNTATITITVNPAPTVTVSGNVSICNGSSTVLTATGGGTYSWSPATGLSSSTSATPAATPAVTTTYTVTVTNAYGCTAAATVTVTVKPIPAAEITVTGNITTACYGGSVEMHAPNITGYTYQWRLNGANIAGATGLSYTATVSGTYTVLVVYNGCGALSAGVTVTILPQSESCPCDIFGPYYTTLNAPITTNLPAGNYYVPANISVTGTVTLANVMMIFAPNVTMSVTATSVLTVDGSHLFACPGVMWQGIVLDNQPGQCTGRIYLQGNALVEDANTGIYCSGALSLDPLSADDLPPLITTDGAIFNRNHTAIDIENYSVTAAQYPFFVKNTVFTSRDFSHYNNGLAYPYAWPLTIGGGIGLKDVLPGTGAFNAPYNIDNTAFPNNGGALTYELCKDGALASTGIRLVNVGTAVAPPGTPSFPPYFGPYTWFDITVGNADNSVKNSNRNLFDHLTYGINAASANLTSLNNVYMHMLFHCATPPTGAYGGDGIYAADNSGGDRCRLQLYTPATADPTCNNQFYDFAKGAEVYNYFELRGDNATMVNLPLPGGYQSCATTETGYYMKSPVFDSIHIRYNTLTDVQNGAAVWASYLPVPLNSYPGPQHKGEIVVNSNVIQMQPAGYTGGNIGQNVAQGIWIENMLAGYNGYFGKVHADYNRMAGVNNGINIQTMGNQASTSSYNYITIKAQGGTGATQYGISHIGDIGSYIQGDTVAGYTDLHAYDKIRAYYINGGSKNIVTCDSETQVGRGFEFNNTTPSAVWQNNRMSDNSEGYVLNASTLGAQGSSGGCSNNKWWGTWGSPTSAPWQTYVTGGANASYSKLWVHTGGTTDPADNGPSVAGRYGLAGTIGTTIFLPLNPCGGGNPTTGGGISFEEVAKDSIMYGTDSITVSWMAQMMLWEDILADSTITDSSAIIQTFADMSDTSRYNYITQIEQYITNGNNDSALALIYNPYDPMLPPNNMDSSTHVWVCDNTTTTSSTDPIVNNYRNLYYLYTKFIDSTMDGTDSAQVFAIASLCPLTNGNVVYKARTFYSLLFDDLSIFSDDSLCDTSNYASRHNNNVRNSVPAITHANNTIAAPLLPISNTLADITGSQKYSLHPNPSDGYIYLQQKVIDNNPVQINVSNMIGQSIYKGALIFEQGKSQLNLKGVISGMYMLELKDSNGNLFNFKFVIER